MFLHQRIARIHFGEKKKSSRAFQILLLEPCNKCQLLSKACLTSTALNTACRNMKLRRICGQLASLARHD